MLRLVSLLIYSLTGPTNPFDHSVVGRDSLDKPEEIFLSEDLVHSRGNLAEL
jgi:hypothetical protein